MKHGRNSSELNQVIYLISNKFDNYETKRREKDKIIKWLKNVMSDVNINVENWKIN